MTEHPAIEALRRCRMDLTAAQARITDALNELKAASFKSSDPDPFERIRREIRNGAIWDERDLGIAVRAEEDRRGVVFTVEQCAVLAVELIEAMASQSGAVAD